MIGDYLSLPEAALHLGQSISTLRRRIKRGDIDYKTVSTPQGHQYWVRVDSVDHFVEPMSPVVEPVTTRVEGAGGRMEGERLFWMNLVERLQKELDYERRRPRSFWAHILDFFR